MKKLCLIFLFVFCSFNLSLSQRATFLSYEATGNFDVFPINDPCNNIETGILLSGYLGMTIGHEFAYNWVLETGFIRKTFIEGYQDAEPTPGFGKWISSSEAFYAMQIPLLVRKSFNLIRNRFFITPVAGYHLSYNFDYGYDSDDISNSFDSTMVYSVVYDNSRSLKRFFSLIETGVSFDYYITHTLNLSLLFSRYTGLNKVYHVDITTNKNNCTTDQAYGYSKGSYWSLGLAFRCRVSNLKKPQDSKKNRPKITK